MDNDATYDGGAIGNRFDGVLTVVDSLLIRNTARHGAGIDNRDTLIVSGVTFNGNSARTWGGGIYNYTGVVTVTNSTFTGNGVNTDAGGGICNNQGTLDVRASAFTHNHAQLTGGGIYNEDIATIADTTFDRNTTARGGGIFHNAGAYGTSILVVTGCDFTSNYAASNGAGIYNNSQLTVTDSTFSHNSGQWGGGIENFNTLYVAKSTFYSNVVTDTGGGICTHGSLTVTNSTFYSNTAGVRGGGINNNGGSVLVTNSTFVDNASDDGSGLRNEETATLVNTMMANDLAGGNCTGLALEAASTHGLATDATCSPGFTQTTAGDLALSWQGWVFEVLTDSVAIDAGTNLGCPTTDQLGRPRPQDGDGDGDAVCDIGAYELSVMDQTIYLPLVLR